MRHDKKSNGMRNSELNTLLSFLLLWLPLISAETVENWRNKWIMMSSRAYFTKSKNFQQIHIKFDLGRWLSYFTLPCIRSSKTTKFYMHDICPLASHRLCLSTYHHLIYSSPISAFSNVCHQCCIMYRCSLGFPMLTRLKAMKIVTFLILFS